jgi:DNA end-binding protein Ku
MAARSIGSLTVSFGLVAIPVKLYTATQSANAISFNLLQRRAARACGSSTSARRKASSWSATRW